MKLPKVDKRKIAAAVAALLFVVGLMLMAFSDTPEYKMLGLLITTIGLSILSKLRG